MRVHRTELYCLSSGPAHAESPKKRIGLYKFTTMDNDYTAEEGDSIYSFDSVNLILYLDYLATSHVPTERGRLCYTCFF